MLKGLMQPAPLLISSVLRHASVAHGTREIVSRSSDQLDMRYDYSSLYDRTCRIANLLDRLGSTRGDRIASLASNTHRHLELLFAVPSAGGVLHAVNPRFSEAQLVYCINHGGSKVLFFEPQYASMLERFRDKLSHIEHFILLGGEDDGLYTMSEYLLTRESAQYRWPRLEEDDAAVLCYTSGTTGDPKGVLYSHRSMVLHALSNSLLGALGVSAFDCVMPCVPLYHAAAWGMPFMAAINGSKLVLPGERLDGPNLHALIRSEDVTFSGGVPTIWTNYLDHVTNVSGDCGTLNRVMIGGSALPLALAETFDNRYGVKVIQVWGMTEVSPLGVVSTPTPQIVAQGDDAMKKILWQKQGRMQFGAEVRIVGDDGEGLAHDGNAAGNLQVRGPWTIQRYFGSEIDAIQNGNWFDTGDVATIDPNGFVRITDRIKDLIKSGGEWIGSIDIENAAMGIVGVKMAAAFGATHPRWEERPVLMIELHEGAQLSETDILEALRPKLQGMWLPERVLFGKVPLTSVGKIDKKALRQLFRNILLEGDGPG